MTRSPTPLAEAPSSIDLDACAAEPIRVPGGIQPHGALLVLAPDGDTVIQHSRNAAERLGVAIFPGQTLRSAGMAAAADLLEGLPRGAATMSLGLVETPAGGLQLSAHDTAQGVIAEFEAANQDLSLEQLYPRIRGVLDRIATAADTAGVAEVAVAEVRALTGFNRVLLYAFDGKGDGTVLAESSDGVLPSYLNLRFPAADIPAQARELYRLSRIRLIPDADYAPAPLEPLLSPVDGSPLDLSHAALRSVSPVHLEYMRNMGTAASMSISILVDGDLWGLISGHSRAPHGVGPQVRAACDHIGRLVSLQIAAREQARRTAERLRLSDIRSDLLTQLAAEEDYAQGLLAAPSDWLAVAGGAGAALVRGDDVITAGETPPTEVIRGFAERLFATHQSSFASDRLPEAWPEAVDHAAVASGLAAVGISQLHPHYLMWFRPEVVRTVVWAGEPAKPVELGDRLHPRKSFELWKEQVRRQALPWSSEDLASAVAFGGAIQAFVLRRAEERAELTSRLAAINAELESFSYSISHDLRAPFRHVVGFADLLAEHSGGELDATAQRYLSNIKEAGLSAGRLVDDLLSFSQLGRNSLRVGPVDMNRLTAEVRRGLESAPGARSVEWLVADLPGVWGDAAMIRQVLQNLFENAVKYSAPKPAPQVRVTSVTLDDFVRFEVADNGVGFDMAYVHKLFAVFQRLHRVEEFEGAGIGLALVRRIIERHGGEVGAHAIPGEGAAFSFTLPRRPPIASPGVH